jgi:hypothetical protein
MLSAPKTRKTNKDQVSFQTARKRRSLLPYVTPVCTVSQTTSSAISLEKLVRELASLSFFEKKNTIKARNVRN